MIDTTLPAGRQVNAAACVAATTGRLVSGLLGPDGVDGVDGSSHPGLPRAGCTVLGADPERLSALRASAAASPEVLTVDVPEAAQSTRVDEEHLAQPACTGVDAIRPLAVGIVDPRKEIDRLTGRLDLLRRRRDRAEAAGVPGTPPHALAHPSAGGQTRR